MYMKDTSLHVYFISNNLHMIICTKYFVCSLEKLS